MINNDHQTETCSPYQRCFLDSTPHRHGMRWTRLWFPSISTLGGRRVAFVHTYFCRDLNPSCHCKKNTRLVILWEILFPSFKTKVFQNAKAFIATWNYFTSYNTPHLLLIKILFVKWNFQSKSEFSFE